MYFRKVFAAIAFVCISLHAQTVPSAVTTDPAPDKEHPAAMVALQIPSHGEKMNAIAYLAAGAGPHPIVVLLHGFPGNERSLDVAQSIRRAGWDVLYFNYRGSWGTGGSFSFTHAIEDTYAALAYLRDPANAQRLHEDPKNIILIGHSMGGMISAIVAAHDPAIRAVGLISAANMAGKALAAVQAGHTEEAVAPIAAGLVTSGIAPLAGCTPESLARDLIANAAAWNIPNLAAGLNPRPMLVITSDDGLAAPNDALVANLRNLKAPHITTLHLPTDHVYSGQRIALQVSVINWLLAL